MDASLVVFIHCTIGEIRDNSAFVKAAEFSKHDAHITLRCDSTGEEMRYLCSPIEGTCWGWTYFRDEWRRKFGQS